MISKIFHNLVPGGLGPRLSVLIFHRVVQVRDPLFPLEPDAAEFAAKLSLVKRWFNVLPLDEAIRRLGTGTLPRRALAITFDDGYRDNYDLAMPILRKLGLHATFFIATGFLDGGRMWNDTVVEVVRNFPGEELDLGQIGLGCHAMGRISDRRATMQGLLSELKYLGRLEREAKVSAMAELTGLRLPDDLMMSSQQVRTMLQCGMGIGAHTRNHPILASERDDDAWSEILEGKSTVESIIGAPASLFAYPNGKPGKDYRAVHVDMIREAGFAGAVSTAWGAAGTGCDPLQIPRFTPWHRRPFRFGLSIVENLVRGRNFQTA
ncbi:MAG: polysaccharide deacetylase family protein [Rhodocyclaceae bacterium]|nr:polysaccharide deacetylase family protein [Rhodocyclaceae bacterium]